MNRLYRFSAVQRQKPTTMFSKVTAVSRYREARAPQFYDTSGEV